MIFQEKIAKEFLESMGRREGPIYEGADIFRWSLNDSKNNFLISKLELARQTNSAWAKKSKMHEDISVYALTKINQFFLSNNLADIKNTKKINYPVINLDQNYLSNGNYEYAKNINKFNLMLIAVNGFHGLINNNRKFYWNSIKNTFEPTYYDSDLSVTGLNLKEINYNIYNYPNINEINELVNELIIDLENINYPLFYENIKNLDYNLTVSQILKKKEIIINNLKSVKNNYKQLLESTSLAVKEKNDILSEALISYDGLRKIKKFEKNFLILQNIENKKFYKCINNYEISNCEEIILKKMNKINLLKDPIKLDNQIFHFGGYFSNSNNQNIDKLFYGKKVEFSNVTEIQGSILYFNNALDVYWNKKNSILKITQLAGNARAFFLGGELKNLNIIFKGFGKPLEKFTNSFDKRGLTGCLSFIDVHLHKISIKSSDTNCEDSINFITTNGQVENINVDTTAFDAIDGDFSNLKFKNILINKSGNDCLDVSYGKYIVDNLIVDGCGDKGISVGERSYVIAKNINIKNTSIGIASKDGSTTELKNVKIDNVDTCISLYKKKQEFFGSTVIANSVICDNYNKKNLIDSYSNLKLQGQ